jgi:hypothetical protein
MEAKPAIRYPNMMKGQAADLFVIIRQPRPMARGSASGQIGCGQQEIQQRFFGSFPK